MGRKRSRETIEKAVKIYNLLSDSDQAVSTPELFFTALENGIIDEYSSLYQALIFLKNRELIQQSMKKGLAYWKAARKVDNAEVKRILLTE